MNESQVHQEKGKIKMVQRIPFRGMTVMVGWPEKLLESQKIRNYGSNR